MPTTIATIAQNVANAHDIDLEVAQRVVQVHVDQIADDPDLYNPDDQTLTDKGVQVVSRIIQVSDGQELWSTTAHDLLDQLDNITTAIRDAQERVDYLTDDRDRIIRGLMGTEVPREHIATVAGLKVARLYQIRDGRR
jgi:hypothetical protein